MKGKILLGLIALITAVFAYAAYTPPAEPPILVETLASSSYGNSVDTVNASETIYFPISNVIAGRYEYAFSIHSDSLSGGPAATVTLQAQNCWSCDDWHDVGTNVTIDGTSTDGSWTGTAYGVDYRLKIVATGTTQANRVEAHSVFKRID